MSKGRALAGKLPGTMRRDPGDAGTTFFGFVDLPPRGAAPLIEPEIEFHPGRLGAAERNLMIEKGERLRVSLSGWYTDTVALEPHQAILLRDALNRMYPAG